jgi:hypothetical protein
MLALAACNQVFGNANVHGFDAPFYDASIDARPTCPVGSVPGFSRDFFQLAVDPCTSITVAGTDMLAICSNLLVYGGLGSNLATVPELPSGGYAPRLAHDGRRMSMIVPLPSTNLRSVVVFHHTGETWFRDPDIATDVAAIEGASEISNGPDARVLVAYGDGVHELDEQSGSWIDVGTHAIAYASESYNGLHLSGDALHGWFSNGAIGYFFDRPSLDSAFVIDGVIAGSDGIEDLDLTDDCGLMYFGALDRIWVAHPTR